MHQPPPTTTRPRAYRLLPLTIAAALTLSAAENSASPLVPPISLLQPADDLLSRLSPAVTPISGPLGLTDISIHLPADPVAAAWVVFTTFTGQIIKAPMVISLSPNAPSSTATVRVMTGPMPTTGQTPGTIRFRILLDIPNAHPVETAEITASTAPPRGRATPDWAKGAVWYQVFVERFRNGNLANDPAPPANFLAPWNSDWDRTTPEELDLARARAAGLEPPQSLPARRGATQLANVLPARRYGGDLEGLTEKLDELRDLGITALYLTPIFEAPSAHKYDASDYRHIDPTFAGPGRSTAEAAAVSRETADPATWTLTAADDYFLHTFMPAVHARGMRLVLDGVWNHVGAQHWSFRDIVSRGVDSPYKDWFRCTFSTDALFPEWPNRMLDLRPGRLTGWKSWNGDGHNGGLVEFARDRSTGRLFPAAEQHILDATSRWSPSIDGWRLDVVPDLPLPFWRAWSDHARSLNPDTALFAEVWSDARAYFEPADARLGPDRIFDGQMNYPFAMPAVRWLSGDARMTSEKLAATLSSVFSHPPQFDLVQMNLLASHDTDRLASMLANPGRDYDQQASPSTNPRYMAGVPSPEIYRRCILAAALQTALPGSPMIFYGDEYAMYGADDPDCRRPLPWPDRGPYTPGTEADAQIQTSVHHALREILRARRDPDLEPPLRFGSLRWLQTGNTDVLALERRLNDHALLFIANRSADRAFDAAPLVANSTTVQTPDQNTPGFLKVPPLGYRFIPLWTGPQARQP